MKKLNKNMKKNRNTIESFGCVCGCGCPCSYCAATWLSQHNADASRVVISNDNSVYPFDSGTSPYMEKHLLKITGIGEYRPFQ